MAQPYIGEIKMFGGNFAPQGWALCHGQLMAIADNETLYQLIGTTYGGDGQVTYRLPDLRGRVPIHVGTGGGGSYQMGEQAGTESVTLTVNQLPAHSHTPLANSATANSTNPQGNYWAAQPALLPYADGPAATAMSANAVGMTGGSQPHDNMVPYLAVNYIISLYGIFPSQG